MSWNDADLFPEQEAARRRGTRPGASVLLLVLVGLVVTFIIWAHYTEIDEITRGNGRVVLSSKTQVIQNLEGGILAEVLVREGDTVQKGDILLRIDSTIADAQYQKSRSEYLSLLGSIARLKAEVDDRDPVFPDELVREAPEVVKNEQSLFVNRRDEQSNELNILEHQALQKKQEVGELRSKVAGIEKTLDFLSQELALNRPLLETGAVSGSEILRLERLCSEQENALTTSRLAIERIKDAEQEAMQRVEAQRYIYRTEGLTKLSSLEAKLAVIREIATAERDRVRRTEVTSPVRGIVKHIRFTTPGGIIKSGDIIMEIVPIEESLLIEAWVSPQDVAFLHPGMQGMVRITAYDSAIYGGLEADLEKISADTFSDSRGSSFFRIHLRTRSTVFKKSGSSLPIIAGMDASVDILTGKKSILNYILNPIRRVQQRALTEK